MSHRLRRDAGPLDQERRQDVTQLAPSPTPGTHAPGGASPAAGCGDLSADAAHAADIAVETWLRGVRDVQRFVERLPLLGLVRTDDDMPIPRRVAGVTQPVPQIHRHLLARPLVRLYIESHLERRLKNLSRTLAIDCLTVGRDAHIARLQALMASIDGFRAARLQTRVRAWLLKYTTPFVLFTVGPATVLGGVGMEDVRRAATLAVLLLSLPVYFLFFRVITVRSGFVPKRALWSGGVTVQAVDRKGGVLLRRWNGFPADDLYRREAEMFAALRAPAEVERPLDIGVGPDVAFVVMVLGGIVGLAAAFRSGGLSPWLVAGIAVAAAFGIGAVRDVVAHRRLRAWRVLCQQVRPASVNGGRLPPAGGSIGAEEMAAGMVARTELDQARFEVGADLHGVRATRVEPAAGR